MSIRNYQLYLSTQITSPTSNNIVPINVVNKANATWQVDFRSLFGTDYGKYRRCSVRVQIHSSTWATGIADENNFDGYISLNLPSTSCASTSKGTPVALISPTFAIVSGAAASYYNVSTLGNVQGTDINMPADNQLLNIQILPTDSFSTLNNMTDYQMMIQFELSDRIE